MVLLMCIIFISGCGNEEKKYLELADGCFVEGKYDYAIYNYLMALEINRENEAAYKNLIDSYIGQERYRDALACLEEAEQMFGEKALSSQRENLEELRAKLEPEPTPSPTATPIPEETPAPTVTDVPVEPTKAPELTEAPEPTEAPQPTATPVPEYTFSEVNKEMYVTGDVNVRKLPSTAGAKVGVLEKGTKVDVLRRCNENGWCEFEYEGSLRYASGRYLSAEKPTSEESTPEEPSDTSQAPETSQPEELSKTGCGHEDMKMYLVDEATCTTDGLIIYVCNVCKSTGRDVLSASGHLYNENDICAVCGEWLEKTEEE